MNRWNRPELSARDLITAEVLDDLEVALEQFREIATDLGPEGREPEKP